MLVISRKIGQQVRIGDRITVTILKTQGQTVRVGIEAPREVKVLRAELPPLSAAGDTVDGPRRRGEVGDGHADRVDPSNAPLGSKKRLPGRETTNSLRRSQSAHPQRWTVTSMRQRVHGQTSPRQASTIGSVHSM
jgi:carbon storage regulator CsrA